MTCISWNDAQAFVRWLNNKEEGIYRLPYRLPLGINDLFEKFQTLTKEGQGAYRLPTEAEWEYAVRAGSDTVFFWGNDADGACRYANLADQTAKRTFSGWTTFDCEDGYVYTAPVGGFQPNAWGLYDMSGNVWEWCQDWYGVYSSGSVNDPTGDDGGSSRAFRGGSWCSRPGDVRCADRGRYKPGLRSPDLGFRLARTP